MILRGQQEFVGLLENAQLHPLNGSSISNRWVHPLRSPSLLELAGICIGRTVIA